MDDALPVRGFDRVDDLAGDRKGGVEIEAERAAASNLLGRSLPALLQLRWGPTPSATALDTLTTLGVSRSRIGGPPPARRHAAFVIPRVRAYAVRSRVAWGPTPTRDPAAIVVPRPRAYALGLGGSAPNYFIERSALDQLHHQRGHGSVVLESVDGRDVRVIERREHLCLATEP